MLTAARPEATTRPEHAGRPGADRLAAELAGYRVHWLRYRRTLWFAGWLFARIITWELVFRRLLGERFVARGRPNRLRRWAEQFRALAVDMGGVMIKLGQFVSSRVDLLPPDVIAVLAALQDEVPTVPFDRIRAILQAELGPLDEHFAAFDEMPVAAASLGQAHRAQLADGSRVVVKVQRPGIGSLVYTDLKALGVVAGWAMKWRFIRRRADVPALLDEFSTVLWDELNYAQEADHVAAFVRIFAADHGIYIPRLYQQHSTGRVITLEDVTAIKISDYDRITEAGVSRQDVAQRLVYTYLWMVFVQRFFHADPHPGNLFIYPLPPDASPHSGQHANGQPLIGRPFYLVFVDFGMVGRVTPAIVDGLSETLIALVNRDAARLVASYQRMGLLLPGADLARIEDAARAAFDRVWGLNMAEIGQMPVSEVAALGAEFKDLLFTLPFQVPQDFLYLTRCVGILAGMCTGLDPNFNPWRAVRPFVTDVLDEDSLVAPFLPFDLHPRDLLRPGALRAALKRENVARALAAALDFSRRAGRQHRALARARNRVPPHRRSAAPAGRLRDRGRAGHRQRHLIRRRGADSQCRWPDAGGAHLFAWTAGRVAAAVTGCGFRAASTSRWPL
jgi:predicted unusual protein kinase regulating ubiquinone biosynthesis (AarF/ABC1/UbiB family)